MTDKDVAKRKAEAQKLYEQGNDFRRKSDWQMAINSYVKALELDEESPAREAKEMIEHILNFYNKDAYNP